MTKVIGTIFVSVIAVVLAIYSAMRSLDFIFMTLPPDQQATGYLALLATEGGIFAWLIFYLSGAKGNWQRSIALVMTVTDLVGSIALFTADTLYRSGELGIVSGMTPDEVQNVILGLSILIALNIFATVACHLFDPEARRRAKEQGAFAKLEEATLAAIDKDADNLAATIAPVVAADWINTARTRYTAGLGTGKIPSQSDVLEGKSKDVKPSGAPSLDIPPAFWDALTAFTRQQTAGAATFSGNGHKPEPVTYNAETEGLPGPLSVAPIAGGK